MIRWPLLALLASLAGCSYATTYDAAMQPHVDDAVDFALKRACALPMDIQWRTIQARGPDYLEGLTLICPEWRGVRDMLAGAVP